MNKVVHIKRLYIPFSIKLTWFTCFQLLLYILPQTRLYHSMYARDRYNRSRHKAQCFGHTL